MIFMDEHPKIAGYEQAIIAIDAPKKTGVFNYDGSFVPYTGGRLHASLEYSTISPEVFATASADALYMDEEVVYIGGMYAHWGHFLVDGTVRMWALAKPECQNKRIVISASWKRGTYPTWFPLLGVSEDRIIYADSPMRLKKIYVPEIAYLPGHFVAADAFLMPFERVKNNVVLDKPVYKKIYLSRTHFTKGKTYELGEKLIEDLFRKNGYQVLYPEELSLEEQVWYYKNCSIMVATNGTIAHNALFVQNGIKLIILNKFPQEEIVHQKVINKIRNLDVQYIDVYARNATRQGTLLTITPTLRDFCAREGFVLVVRKWYVGAWLKLIFALRRFCLMRVCGTSIACILNSLRLWRKGKEA